jgi:predicted MFS family arabinose efflux permease
MRRLAASTGFTSLGKWGFAVTLSVYAFGHGGAKAVGLVALAQALPAMALAPFLALLGDQRPRRSVLVAVNLTRAAVLGLVALAIAAGQPPLVVFATAVLYSVVSTANQPARAALLTALSDTPRHLSAAIALLGSADTLGFVAGSGLGGLLLAATSPQAVTAACAGAYVLAVGVLYGIPADERRPRRRRAHPLEAAREAAGALNRNEGLRAAFGLIAALALTDGLTNVLIVVVAIDLVGLGPAGVGELNTAFGVGGLLAGPVLLALLRRRAPALGAPLGALLAGVPLMLLAATTHGAVAVGSWASLGLGVALVRASALTLAQRLAPDRILSGMFGLLEMAVVAGTGIGAALAPLILTVIGTHATLLISGAFLPLACLLLWLPLRARAPEASVTPADFRLLRAEPIFAPLSIATVEGLAAGLPRRHVAADETIIEQGERGDAFFLVQEGEVEVLVDGEPVRRIGPGGSFGEIALLRDLPRTATVRATAPTELRVLGRDRFLLAVTGEPDSHDAARERANSLLDGSRAAGYGTA